MLKAKTLDSLVREDGRLNGPMLLKLDVQGAEISVLQGSTETLKRTEVIQLEIALLKYNEGAPLFADVVYFMNQKGFVMFDILEFIRPNGKDLVQIDAIFVSVGSDLRPEYFVF